MKYDHEIGNECEKQWPQVFSWGFVARVGVDLDTVVPHLALAAQLSTNAKPNTYGH